MGLQRILKEVENVFGDLRQEAIEVWDKWLLTVDFHNFRDTKLLVLLGG